MKKKYAPDLEPMDEEERELEHLDASTALPSEVREALLSPYRAETKKNVTIRLPESVIAALKEKAAKEGIPYQTLATMVLRKYSIGEFLDKDSVREVVKALTA